MKRLKGLKYKGLCFTAVHDLDPLVYNEKGNGYWVFLDFPWKFGWITTQMNEYLFLGFCYLSWSM